MFYSCLSYRVAVAAAASAAHGMCGGHSA